MNEEEVYKIIKDLNFQPIILKPDIGEEFRIKILDENDFIGEVYKCINDKIYFINQNFMKYELKDFRNDFILILFNIFHSCFKQLKIFKV